MLCVIVVGLALCIVVLSCVYCCHLMCICCTVCIAVFFTIDAGLLARSQYSEGPGTATSTQVFLGFPVSISKC